MDLFLTARSGFTKGASWVVHEPPLTIGRARTCEIVVDDRTVSRKHCVVQREGTGLRLRDVGSQNLTLVNGVPVENALLAVGDEFSVGTATFMVSATALRLAPDSGHRPGDETVSTAVTELGLFSEDDTPSDTAGWIAGLEDYQVLFRLGRSLSLQSDLSQLIQTVRDFFRSRFGSDDLFVVRKREGGWVSHYPENQPFPESLGVWFDTVTKFQRAYVVNDETVPVPYLVAPVRCGPTDLGVCALPVEHYDLAEARVGIAIYSVACEMLGPFLQNLERIERLAASNARLVDAHESGLGIVGVSRAIQRLRRQIRDVADTDLSVLIVGETGTGKELVARSIHELSRRSNKPCIVVNCASIPDELFESEFFGHTRGAFTGAIANKRGLVELADGGTLFLDEVGELSTTNQAKLLRVVEQGTYRRVGEEAERAADIRFIAASNRRLESNGFRTDLFHRLAGIVIEIPPLRQRKSDIPPLAERFLDEVLARRPEWYRVFDPDAVAAMREHDWPGNVRELRNVVERAAQLCPGETIHAAHLFDARSPVRNGKSAPMRSLSEIEAAHIESVLVQCDWNISKTARVLGISRSTLYQKIAEYELQRG